MLLLVTSMCFNITSIFLSAEKWVRGRAIDRGEVEIGTQQSQTVPPGLFWRFHMTVHHPTYIKFNLSLSHNALLGVYGRRNIPPTHTQVMAVMLFTQMILYIWLYVYEINWGENECICTTYNVYRKKTKKLSDKI